jgi:hypothetical protein
VRRSLQSGQPQLGELERKRPIARCACLRSDVRHPAPANHRLRPRLAFKRSQHCLNQNLKRDLPKQLSLSGWAPLTPSSPSALSISATERPVSAPKQACEKITTSSARGCQEFRCCRIFRLTARSPPSRTTQSPLSCVTASQSWCVSSSRDTRGS